MLYHRMTGELAKRRCNHQVPTITEKPNGKLPRSKREGGLMAKPRRSALRLSAEQAQAALAVLIQQGKLRAGEVQKALQRRDRLIRDLRAKLAALEAGVVKAGRRVLKNGFFPMAAKRKTAKRPTVRRKPKISAATRKMYQQQGRYMAALRPLSKDQRAKVKAIREKSGVRKAIAAARRMVG